jgi:hypothetical protein
MNRNKLAAAFLIAFAVILGLSWGAVYLGAFLSALTNVDLDFVLMFSDFVRLVGPIVGGYYFGRRSAEHGIVGGFVVGLIAAMAFEVANPDWYFHEFWHQILTGAITYFAVPSALAGGCGELHSRRLQKESL